MNKQVRKIIIWIILYTIFGIIILKYFIPVFLELDYHEKLNFSKDFAKTMILVITIQFLFRILFRIYDINTIFDIRYFDENIIILTKRKRNVEVKNIEITNIKIQDYLIMIYTKYKIFKINISENNYKNLFKIIKREIWVKYLIECEDYINAYLKKKKENGA